MSCQLRVNTIRIMLSSLRQRVASVLPPNSRASRRQTSSPPQGPPGTRPVGGLRTFRVLRTTGIKSPVPLRPSYPPLTLRIPRPTLLSSYQGIVLCGAGKCRPRGASVPCECSAPEFSVRAVRAVCRLRQLRCWVAPGRDSSSSAGSVRRVPSLRSSVSLRLG